MEKKEKKNMIIRVVMDEPQYFWHEYDDRQGVGMERGYLKSRLSMSGKGVCMSMVIKYEG